MSFRGIPIWSLFTIYWKIGVKTYFLAASTVTTSCLSIYAAFLIGYRLAGSFKCDQIPAGLISVFAFFITTPLTKDSGLMMEFMGAKGLFGAMIAALIATRIYCAFMNVDKLKLKCQMVYHQWLLIHLQH